MNIKTNLGERECGVMQTWTDLCQDRDEWRALVNMVFSSFLLFIHLSEVDVFSFWS
jgi:hypothetical protein